MEIPYPQRVIQVPDYRQAEHTMLHMQLAAHGLTVVERCGAFQKPDAVDRPLLLINARSHMLKVFSEFTSTAFANKYIIRWNITTNVITCYTPPYLIDPNRHETNTLDPENPHGS